MGRKESNQTKQNILYEFQGMPSDDSYLPRYGLNTLLYGNNGEHSDSVVECMTRDQGVGGWSLIRGTALCP